MIRQVSMVVVLLAALLCLGMGLPARFAEPADGPSLFGCVVTEAGQPVEGASVCAWAFACRGLRNVAMAHVTTDRDGRFVLPVPFHLVRYALSVSGGGRTAQGTGFAEDGREIRITSELPCG